MYLPVRSLENTEHDNVNELIQTSYIINEEIIPLEAYAVLTVDYLERFDGDDLTFHVRILLRNLNHCNIALLAFRNVFRSCDPEGLGNTELKN